MFNAFFSLDARMVLFMKEALLNLWIYVEACMTQGSGSPEKYFTRTFSTVQLTAILSCFHVDFNEFILFDEDIPKRRERRLYDAVSTNLNVDRSN